MFGVRNFAVLIYVQIPKWLLFEQPVAVFAQPAQIVHQAGPLAQIAGSVGILLLPMYYNK